MALSPKPCMSMCMCVHLMLSRQNRCICQRFCHCLGLLQARACAHYHSRCLQNTLLPLRSARQTASAVTTTRWVCSTEPWQHWPGSRWQRWPRPCGDWAPSLCHGTPWQPCRGPGELWPAVEHAGCESQCCVWSNRKTRHIGEVEWFTTRAQADKNKHTHTHTCMCKHHPVPPPNPPTHTCMHKHMYTYTCTHTRTHTHTHTHTNTHTHTHTLYL